MIKTIVGNTSKPLKVIKMIAGNIFQPWSVIKIIVFVTW